MPLRPFPFPLRVGTDICSIARIEKLITVDGHQLDSSRLSRFLPKIFTWPEQQYFWRRFKGWDDASKASTGLKSISQFLAGRWAAKEACRKACVHMGSSSGLHSIMILPITVPKGIDSASTTRPQGLVLRECLSFEATKTTAEMEYDVEASDGQLCEVSISHDTQWAAAVALVPIVQEWQSEHNS